jgi:hypothetical protein
MQGINKESLRTAIELVTNSELDRETLHSELIMELVKNLKFNNAKEMAIEQCKELKQELDRSKPTDVKKSWGIDSSDFKRKEKINNLVQTVFRLNIELCEYKEAIQYFRDNYIEKEKEIFLYVLLKLLFEYDLIEYWLGECNRALGEGIKPRSALLKMNTYIQENGRMPEYIPF